VIGASGELLRKIRDISFPREIQERFGFVQVEFDPLDKCGG
jgi:hypothetical protein